MRTLFSLVLLAALAPAPAAAHRAILLVGVGDAETGAFGEGSEDRTGGEKHASPGGDPSCGALLMWSR